MLLGFFLLNPTQIPLQEAFVIIQLCMLIFYNIFKEIS